MNRQWSSEETYRPPLGHGAAPNSARQPSFGASQGSAFGQGFAQMSSAAPPLHHVPLSGSGVGPVTGSQPTVHQQFMNTHYTSGIAQSGLTQRTPSVGTHQCGAYPPQSQQLSYPQPAPSTTSGTSYVPTSAFGVSGGFHELRGGTPASVGSPSPTHSSGAPQTGVAHRFGFPEDDLPLLDELGIHPSHIKGKAIAVLHPLGRMREEAISDPDLAGPFVFAVVLGFLLSLQGKVQFSAIYGLSSLGMFGFRVLIGLMSEEDVKILHIISTLGYCLLPNLVLASVQTILWWATGSHTLALPFAAVTIMWSAWCACQMFAKLFGMESQRFLLLYPLAVFYSMFAALTIF